MILFADNTLQLFWFPNVLKNYAMKPIALESSFFKGGNSCVWLWVKFFMCAYFVITFYNTKSSKSTVFFPCNINLHRAMLSKCLGTYSSALCQIWALEKAFEERNKCQSYPKSWVLGCMHLIGQNKQSTFRQCTVYLPSNKDLHV